jgi:hypothetical protein
LVATFVILCLTYQSCMLNEMCGRCTNQNKFIANQYKKFRILGRFLFIFSTHCCIHSIQYTIFKSFPTTPFKKVESAEFR